MQAPMLHLYVEMENFSKDCLCKVNYFSGLCRRMKTKQGFSINPGLYQVELRFGEMIL